jgi:hypothetical protein
LTVSENVSVHDRFRDFRARVSAYFIAAAESLVAVSDPTKVWVSDLEGAYYWSHLPDSIKALATNLVGEWLKLATDISVGVRSSGLVTDADRGELAFMVKTVRAALRLRRYRHFGVEVLSDEDRVLGVRPASQDEDEPMAPVSAALRCAEALSRTEDLLLLAAAPSLGGQDVSVLEAEAIRRYRPNTAFIMMWMDPSLPELEDLSDTVKRSFSRFGITARRADDIEHEDVITGRILDEIKTAEFLFADLTGERPSVYYEVGFAHALGRRVILFRRRGARVHFDLAAYNCPEYENFKDLAEKLLRRLESVTGRRPSSAA